MISSDLAERLEGVFVPMFTPFTRDAAHVDEFQLRSNVQYLVSRGIRMLNPAGTTGEFWTLSREEHHQLIRTVCEEARNAGVEVDVIPGVTSQNLHDTLAACRVSQECGVDIVQLALPYYLPLGDGDVIEYYRRVGEQSGLAIMIYEIPPANGVRIAGDLLARICDACPQVIALKSALPATAPREFERTVRRFGEQIRIFSATGAYYSPFTYMTGIAGITDTLANVVPEFGMTLHRMARARQWEEMNAIYQDAFDVLEIEIVYGRSGLKTIGNLCGTAPGPTRYPMTSPLSISDLEDIYRRLERWSFTRDLVKGCWGATSSPMPGMGKAGASA